MIDGRPVWVSIPTIGHSPYLISLVNAIEQDRAVDKILLTVNLEEYVEPISEFFQLGEPTIEVVPAWKDGPSIHNGWNISIEAALEANAWLAVLNDDIRLIEPNAVSHVAGILAENPSYAIVGFNWQESAQSTRPSARCLSEVCGSYRHHGIGGFAWVCDPHKIRTVPETLIWWGGDDAIFFYAEQDGYKLGIANHVHVEHAHSLTANSGEQTWMADAIAQDRVEFEKLFPGRGW